MMEELQKDSEQPQEPEQVCTARISIGFIAFLAILAIAVLLYLLLVAF